MLKKLLALMFAASLGLGMIAGCEKSTEEKVDDAVDKVQDAAGDAADAAADAVDDAADAVEDAAH